MAKQKKKTKVFPPVLRSCRMCRRGASFPFAWLRRVLLPPEQLIHLPTKPVGSARIRFTGIIKIPKANLKTNNLPSSPLPKTTIQFQSYLTKATFLMFCISISYRTETACCSACKNRIKYWFLIPHSCRKNPTLLEKNYS